MESIPLHPALVHLPLALAVLFPLVAGAGLLLVFGGRRRAWWAVVAMLAVLAGGAATASRVGEADEERIRGLVGHDPLERHEERAEAFVQSTLALLLLALAVPFLTGRRRVQRALAAAVFVGGLYLAGLGLGVGHSGGELVYRHGAAAAWAGGFRQEYVAGTVSAVSGEAR